MDVEVDLRNSLPAVRDQGDRPTCLAMATSDAHTVVRGNCVELSAEWLYYFTVKRMPVPDPTLGATLNEVAEALESDGQPIETEWPYSLVQPTPWEVPDGVTDIWTRDSDLTGNSIERVKEEVRAGRAAVLGIRLWDKFEDHLDAPFVIEGDGSQGYGGHAVLVLGIGLDPHGRSCLLIRNSWGNTWGDDGCAWLPEEIAGQQVLGHLVLI